MNKYAKIFISLADRGQNSELQRVDSRRSKNRTHIFANFIKSINKLNPFEFLTDVDIRTVIINANGLRKSLFLPEAAFKNLLRTQICGLKSLECAQQIHKELRKLINSIRIPEIERFENLSFRIISLFFCI